MGPKKLGPARPAIEGGARYQLRRLRARQGLGIGSQQLR